MDKLDFFVFSMDFNKHVKKHFLTIKNKIFFRFKFLKLRVKLALISFVIDC